MWEVQTELLDIARKIVRKKKDLIGPILGCGVFLMVILFRYFGMLELLELKAYDFFQNWQPRVLTSQNRITIVTVTEADIASLAHWPISDQVLARAIAVLLRYQPLAIGLDIYRDIPVPPGYEYLTAIFSENSNIVAAMKCGSALSNSIKAPQVLQGTDRMGFVDMISDTDGMVRRGILFMDNGKEFYYSFALRMAMQFLHPMGISVGPSETDSNAVQLGRTTIAPFESNDGGYHRADAGGYQLLLDYRDDGRYITRITMMQLLNNAIDGSVISGKLVFFGVDAESVKDYFHVPIRSFYKDSYRISGVELHALIANQLIAYALGERKPIRPFSKSFEIVWIWFWSILP
ncbi:CHASE2 domain-containing protein [Desulfatirhabdium butyrativorans]|uniref:CHASE2 domain-containing protein n=1 Tax=Desulfatirhabdium butyrativorans TaxID=340467 RepID=UPI0003FFD842|nr:CHASE2 domain-containing protein [Desulfatirhabdium butyrativorans]